MSFTKVSRSISLGIAIALVGVVAGQTTSSAMDAAGKYTRKRYPKGLRNWLGMRPWIPGR